MHTIEFVSWKEFLRECRVMWFYAMRFGDEIETCLYTGQFCYFHERPNGDKS
jgi:hypothetical protein